MLLIIDSGEAWDPKNPEVQSQYAKIGQWFAGLAAAGKLVSGEELQPVKSACTVRFNGRQPILTDGPFMEAKETVGGFALIDVASREEALALAKSWPGSGPIEIRPCVEHPANM